MGYFKELFSLGGRLNMFSIILTATILTIFEIIFFYNVVVPDVNNTLNYKLKLLEEKITNLSQENKDKLLKLFDKQLIENYSKDNYKTIDNIFSVLIERETLLIEKNNSNTIIVSITILLFLALFILATILSIKRDVNYKGFSTFRESIIVTFITVGLLIGFQILFYNFSQNYYYPSNNELLKIMVSSLKLD
jgi:hypothetical protein